MDRQDRERADEQARDEADWRRREEEAEFERQFNEAQHFFDEQADKLKEVRGKLADYTARQGEAADDKDRKKAENFVKAY